MRRRASAGDLRLRRATTGFVVLCSLAASTEALALAKEERLTIKPLPVTGVETLIAGDPYIAFVDTGRPQIAATVRDTRTRTQTEVPAIPGCPLKSIGAGRALFLCFSLAAPGDSQVITTTLAGGDRRAFSLKGDDFPDPSGIGAHWISFGGLKPNTKYYINWRTGQREYGRADFVTRDLDSPNLALIKQSFPPNPRVLNKIKPPRYDIRGQPLRVKDGDKIRRLSDCLTACVSPRLRAGRVMWREGRRVRVDTLATGHRATLTLPPGTLFSTATGYEILLVKRTANGLRYQYAILKR